MAITLITSIVLFLVFGILIHRGKLAAVYLNHENFTDSYEYQDFLKSGRIKKDYYPWKGNEQECLLVITYRLSFLSKQFQWGNYRPIALQFSVEFNQEDDQFYVGMKDPVDKIREYSPAYPMTIRLEKGKSNGKFLVFIRKREIDTLISTPKEFRLHIKASFNEQRFGIFRSSGTKHMVYEFFIGPDLGETWVAFDPGTNGSCIAAGSARDTSIFMEKEEGGLDKITPSVITFNKTVEFVDKELDTPNFIYKIGKEAQFESTLERSQTFQSIKKLLGYKDHFSIDFANGKNLVIDGVGLSSLLVKGIYRELITSIQKDTSRNKAYLEAGNFSPQRAVVTVPNNFTALKINSMLQCIHSLNLFKEIRYLTEAEAVLCFYVFEHSDLHRNPTGGLTDETVLIFDMGGATINGTVADVFMSGESGENAKYKILIDTQIGYGIGGDTIDYCLAKTFFQFEEVYPALKKHNPFNPALNGQGVVRRRNVQQIIFNVKMKIIDRYYHNPLIIKTGNTESTSLTYDELFTKKNNETKVLLTPAEIEDYLYQLTGENILIEESSPLYEQFKENNFSYFPVFSNSFFSTYVFGPIEEAVNDLTKVSEGSGGFIDTVLFAGRSTLFPMVKETVLRVVQKIGKASKPEEKITPFVLDYLGERDLKVAIVKGAAYYAVHKETIELSPQRVSSTFGFKRTNSAAKYEDFEFFNLVEMGANFKEANGSYACFGQVSLKDRFDYDGNHVNFYQIMGTDAYNILKKKQWHKVSKLSEIKLTLPSERISIEVSNSDMVKASVTLVSGQTLSKDNLTADMEIVQANDEHYTWIIK